MYIFGFKEETLQSYPQERPGIDALFTGAVCESVENGEKTEL